MEFISLSYVHNNVLKQYGKHKHLKSKINDYFNSFVDRHQDLKYLWYDSKAYIPSQFGFQLKKEIEKKINKSIRPIYAKIFNESDDLDLKDNIYIKQKIAEKKQQAKDLADAKREANILKLKDYVRKIKSGEIQFIGSFDLEFWERDMNRILEFGWSIMDYKGNTKTTHIVVQDNLNYENGVFSKNNRYARKDSKTKPLNIAIKEFEDNFINKVGLFIGHGLTNDFKVLKANGVDLDIEYLDTSEIGAALMGVDDTVSIERLLKFLNIESTNLHNAANDAEYVLEAFKAMGEL